MLSLTFVTSFLFFLNLQEIDFLYIVKNKKGRNPKANTVNASSHSGTTPGQCKNLNNPPNPKNSAAAEPEIIVNRSDIVLAMVTSYLPKNKSGTKTSNSSDPKISNSLAYGQRSARAGKLNVNATDPIKPIKYVNFFIINIRLASVKTARPNWW